MTHDFKHVPNHMSMEQLATALGRITAELWTEGLGRAVVLVRDPTRPDDRLAAQPKIRSYRGWYEQVAIDQAGREGFDWSPSHILHAVTNAIGADMEGYKGGMYPCRKETRVWLSSYGDASGIALVGVEFDRDAGVVWLVGEREV
jgi:hypothetical protein